jgi:hypothetical protein
MWASAYFHFTCGWEQAGDAFARHETYRYRVVPAGTVAGLFALGADYRAKAK